MAEWLGDGLQSRSHWFESFRHFHSGNRPALWFAAPALLYELDGELTVLRLNGSGGVST